MKINRCETLTEAVTGPYIEIRDAGDGCYLLHRALLEDESLLTGPFPTATVAEQAGVAEAERRGLETLNIVWTSAN